MVPTETQGQVVLRTTAFDADFAELTERLGFRVEVIFPADSPTTAVVSGHGVRIRLESAPVDEPITLQLVAGPGDDVSAHATTTLAGGSEIAVVPRAAGYELPASQPTLVVSHLSQVGSELGTGRAGMKYRDLIPDRWGGRVIASHIVIPDGGPVPDYVHFHKIRFQLIFVKSGWVRVVYEDQGEPFVMQAGDAVLQPPEIRHRVLEASPGLEVIEVGTPALHETIADWSLELPNGVGDPNRRWAGQAFARHVAADASYRPWRADGWEQRDTGIGAATNGLADVKVARPIAGTTSGSVAIEHDDEFLLLVVVTGEVQLSDTRDEQMQAGSSVAIPPGLAVTLSNPTNDCQLLEVAIR